MSETQFGRDLCATGRHDFEDGGPCVRCGEPAPSSAPTPGEANFMQVGEPVGAWSKLVASDPTLMAKVIALQTAPGDGRDWMWRLIDCAVEHLQGPSPASPEVEASPTWAEDMLTQLESDDRVRHGWDCGCWRMKYYASLRRALAPKGETNG